jgi:hypothetical protein
MNLTTILSDLGGLSSIASELGISESQAATGAAALLPAILGGFKKQAQAQPTGLDGLGGILASLGGSGLLDSVLSPTPTNVDSGNSVLGQIFGSKDVSRTVAQNAAEQTGLDAGVLKKMLPLLAMLVAGYMARQHNAGSENAAAGAPPESGLGGLLSGILGNVLGGSGGVAVPNTTDAPVTAPTTATNNEGALASIIDMNHDGNALDDILRMAGKLMH